MRVNVKIDTRENDHEAAPFRQARLSKLGLIRNWKRPATAIVDIFLSWAKERERESGRY